MKLVGANAAPVVEGLDPLPTKSHYLLGNDPKKWITNVPHYAKVKHHDVYPGIDQVYYGKDGLLEYDLIVQPNANASKIRLTFEGAESVQLNSAGDVVLQRQAGKHTTRVFTYQPAGKKNENPPKPRPVSEVNTRAWRQALKRAGIKNFRWHDLRHTWASWHVQAGTPLQALQELGG